MLDPCEVQRFGSSSAGSGPLRAGHGQSGPDPGTGDPAAGEIVEARRRIGMLGAERRLADRQRALVERPRPRTTASDDDMAQVWDAAGQEITSLRGHAGWVTTAAFSPDGARIVTASDDHTARVWDAATGQEGTSLPGHAGSVTSADFPSGRAPPSPRIVSRTSAKGRKRSFAQAA